MELPSAFNFSETTKGLVTTTVAQTLDDSFVFVVEMENTFVTPDFMLIRNFNDSASSMSPDVPPISSLPGQFLWSYNVSMSICSHYPPPHYNYVRYDPLLGLLFSGDMAADGAPSSPTAKNNHAAAIAAPIVLIAVALAMSGIVLAYMYVPKFQGSLYKANPLRAKPMVADMEHHTQ